MALAEMSGGLVGRGFHQPEVNGAEALGERISYTMMQWVDALMPKEAQKAVDKDSELQMAEWYLTHLDIQPTRGNDSLSSGIIRQVIAVTTPKLRRQVEAQTNSQQTRVEVVVPPGELSQMYVALTALANLAEVNIDDLDTALDTVERKQHTSVVESALCLLSVIHTLALLEKPGYRQLAAYLRTRVLAEKKVTTYSDLTKLYSGGIIELESFWLSGIQPRPFAMPDHTAFQLQVADNLSQKSAVARQTPARTVIQAAALKDPNAVERYRQKPLLEQQRKKAQRKLVETRFQDWRLVWQDALTELRVEDTLGENSVTMILYGVRALTYLFSPHSEKNSVAPQGYADPDLTRKGASAYAQDVMYKAPEYGDRLRNLVMDLVRQKDPMVLWFLMWSNQTLADRLEATILQQPEAFLEYAKLMVSELSRIGLLSRSGEVDLLFRPDSSVADAQAQARLPQMVRSIREVQSAVTKRGLRSGRDIKVTENVRTVSETACLAVVGDEQLQNLTKPDALAQTTRRLCRDQAKHWLPEKQAVLAEWLMRLRMKSGTWFYQHFEAPLKKLHPQVLLQQARSRFRFDQQEYGQLGEKFMEVVGAVYAASETTQDMQDLPFIATTVLGGDDRHFFRRSFTGSQEQLTEEQLDRIRDLSGGNDWVVSLLDSVEPIGMWGCKPLYDIDINRLAAAKPQSAETVQAVMVGFRQQVVDTPDTIMPSCLNTTGKSYDLEERYQPASAKDLNTKLSGAPRLQRIHGSLIAALDTVNLKNPQVVSQMVELNIKQLQAYFQHERFYSVIPNQDAPRQDVLTWLADHPRSGFECQYAAMAVVEYLQSVGLPAVMTAGYRPYVVEGQICLDQTCGHAIVSVLLPNGLALDLDFTPPMTAETPAGVRAQFEKRQPSSQMRENAVNNGVIFPHTQDGQLCAEHRTTGTRQQREKLQKKRLKKSRSLVVAEVMTGLGLAYWGITANPELSQRLALEIETALPVITHALRSLFTDTNLPELAGAPLTPGPGIEVAQQSAESQLWLVNHWQELAQALGFGTTALLGMKGVSYWRRRYSRPKPARVGESTNAQSRQAEPEEGGDQPVVGAETVVQAPPTPALTVEATSQVVAHEPAIVDTNLQPVIDQLFLQRDQLSRQMLERLAQLDALDWQAVKPYIDVLIVFLASQSDPEAILKQPAEQVFTQLAEVVFAKTQPESAMQLTLHGLRMRNSPAVAELRQWFLLEKPHGRAPSSHQITQLQQAVQAYQLISEIEQENSLNHQLLAVGSVMLRNQTPDSGGATQSLMAQLAQELEPVVRITEQLSLLIQRSVGVELLNAFRLAQSKSN